MASYRPFPHPSQPPPPLPHSSFHPPPPPPPQQPPPPPPLSNQQFHRGGYVPPQPFYPSYGGAPPQSQYNIPPGPLQSQQGMYYNQQYDPPPPPPPLPPPSSPPPPPPKDPPPPRPKEASKLPPPRGRAETEEERRQRKKREYEKQKQMQHALNKQAHAPNKMAAGKGHGSIAGSQQRRAVPPLLAGERTENRLKKPTTFICKFKFRNELPDPTAQPKYLSMNTDKDRYTKYSITSLEKNYKPKLYVEPDLGIPIDLLDLRIYDRPANPPPLDPKDEELLRDDDVTTPVKPEGIRKKERPTDKGVSWLVKTQYISPMSMDSAKQSITEKQAKEMREAKGNNLVENLNNRERQIQAIEESFKAARERPVHQTNPTLQPVEVLPLLPDFDRYDDRFVMVSFDADPTADSEEYKKLDKSVRDEYESQAIMKSFMANGSDPTKPEKFLAYMVPAPGELSKDMYDESEELSYNWVREYHWDVRGDDTDDPTTYLVNFEDDAARYLPLHTKLVLQKKKAKEGRSGDEVEHYPVPSSVTVRRRSVVSVGEGSSSSQAKFDKASKRDKSPRDDDIEEEDQNGEADNNINNNNNDRYSEEEDISD